MKHVLFVCTGNTCRSPMAEALLKHKTSGDIQVKSAGIYAADGSPASQHTTEVLKSKGITFSHQSSALNEPLVNWADIILTMTENHKAAIHSQYPEAVDKVFTLKEYVNEKQVEELNWDKLKQAYVQLEMKRNEFLQKWEDHKVENANKSIEHELYKALETDLAEIAKLEASVPSYDISDPYGGSKQVYEKTMQELEEAIDKLIKKLND